MKLFGANDATIFKVKIKYFLVLLTSVIKPTVNQSLFDCNVAT